tara:strand:+ start:612 stop:1358 length:747 start_codon:yes stop_codon:yes gene_type:complete
VTAKRQHGKLYKGHTLPYGTLADASYELRQAYYANGYLHDKDMPELPYPPQEYDEYVDPIEELHKGEMVIAVQELLDAITPRESKILHMRFGIGLTEEYTFEEIAPMFEVTRERIRQIEAKAIRKAKHPERLDKLRDLMGYYQTTEEKEAQEQAARAEWERQRIERQEKAAKAQEAHEAMKIADYAARVKALADLKEWEDLKPMVSDVDWVARLKTDNPAMYQELKYRVGDIWGKSAKEVWRVYAKEE